MGNDDPGDLDGDGKFDGIDISIIEDDRGTRRPSNNGGGCCLMLFILGSTVGAGWWSVSHYLI